MKNLDEVLRAIPFPGKKKEAQSISKLNSEDCGYQFYTEYDGGVTKYALTPKEEMTNMAEPPKGVTVDNSISEALMRLSITHRNEIEEEVHGIVKDPEETPEFMSFCLREFDRELATVKNSKKRLRKLEVDGQEDVLRNVIRTTEDFSAHGSSSSDSESTVDTSSPLFTPSDQSINTVDGSVKYPTKASKRLCYVNHNSVRLRFIRAELYDCKKAVKRFVNFLVFAQELYGNFVADRPIKISDFKTRQEKWALSNVSFQFLPFRDRSGRRVFVSVGACGYDIEPVTRIKALWYMFWIASEDAESQRKGAVLIGWPSDSIINQTDETSSSDSPTAGMMDSEDSVWEESLRQNLVVKEGVYQVKALDGLPLRIASLHLCFEDRPIYRLLNSLFHFSLNPYLKARYKVHIGEPLEIRYKLQGFGIPIETLPLTHTMAIKRQNHAQWIALRKAVEKDETSSDDGSGKGKGKKNTPKPMPFDPKDRVECPGSYDVIIGKAKYKNNPGNVYYRSLIEATHDEHISSSKREKVELTWRIVRQMEERNGSFLEMNKSLKAWVRIKDRNVMRQKVAQSFKEYKRNAGFKRNQLDAQRPVVPMKRIRTAVANPVVRNESCFSGCISGFDCEKANDYFTGFKAEEESSGFEVSRSIFGL